MSPLERASRRDVVMMGQKEDETNTLHFSQPHAQIKDPQTQLARSLWVPFLPCRGAVCLGNSPVSAHAFALVPDSYLMSEREREREDIAWLEWSGIPFLSPFRSQRQCRIVHRMKERTMEEG